MKILVSNRKALFDYSILEEMTAGLVLSGAEVKSLKAGQGSLKGSYISVRSTTGKGSGGEAFLVKAHITPYKYAASAKDSAIKKDVVKKAAADPERERKLLLNKAELNSLLGKDKGGIVIPLEIFEGRRSLIKIKIGIGRSKKKFDKRESIKKRDVERRIRAES